MKETVEMIVKALVDDVAAVDVREIERDKTTSIIEVRVAETDMGKLIGRQGRTVRALRVLLRAASIKQNHRFMLEIVE
ncbi:MAG: KH domain-containing protein [Pyrinomonadaceae bacterium]